MKTSRLSNQRPGEFFVRVIILFLWFYLFQENLTLFVFTGWMRVLSGNWNYTSSWDAKSIPVVQFISNIVCKRLQRSVRVSNNRSLYWDLSRCYLLWHQAPQVYSHFPSNPWDRSFISFGNCGLARNTLFRVTWIVSGESGIWTQAVCPEPRGSPTTSDLFNAGCFLKKFLRLALVASVWHELNFVWRSRVWPVATLSLSRRTAELTSGTLCCWPNRGFTRIERGGSLQM